MPGFPERERNSRAIFAASTFCRVPRKRPCMSNTCTDSAVHSREGRLPASDVVPSAELEVSATELEVAGVELEVAGVELDVVTTELELFADELEVAGVELELRARELDETAPYSYAPRSGDLPTNGIPTSVPRSII